MALGDLLANMRDYDLHKLEPARPERQAYDYLLALYTGDAASILGINDPHTRSADALERIADHLDAIMNAEPSGMLGMLGGLFGGRKE